MDGIYSDRLEYKSCVICVCVCTFLKLGKILGHLRKILAVIGDVSAIQFSVQDHLITQTKRNHSWLWYLLDSAQIFLGYILEQRPSVVWSCVTLSSPLAATVAGTQILPESFLCSKGRDNHQNQCWKGYEILGKKTQSLNDNIHWFPSTRGVFFLYSQLPMWRMWRWSIWWWLYEKRTQLNWEAKVVFFAVSPGLL